MNKYIVTLSALSVNNFDNDVEISAENAEDALTFARVNYVEKSHCFKDNKMVNSHWISNIKAKE